MCTVLRSKFVENEHGKNGHTYNKRDAFCLETQVEPNAVNVEDFHPRFLMQVNSMIL